MAMPKRRVQRTCERCGTEFEVVRSVAEAGFGKFCSMACRVAAKSEPQEGRTCTVCGEYKLAPEFDLNPSQPKRLRPECRECRKTRARAYYERTKGDRIAAKMLREYGLGAGDYERILESQGGGCAICGALEPGGTYQRLVVDHDHATGRVRGLLCGACNTGLGNFRDDRRLLRSAISYLDKTE